MIKFDFIISFLFFISLVGCGGAGGTSEANSEESVKNELNSTDLFENDKEELLIEDIDSFTEALQFSGAERIKEEFILPEMPEGGNISSDSLVTLSSAKSSTLSVEIEVAVGSYIHAILIQFEGSSNSFLIPIGGG